MSILTKIEDKTLSTKTRAERVNKGIAHAAKVLHESTLGKRCPNLLKGLEAESRDAKYQAATLVQLLENTAEYYRKEQGVDLLTEAEVGGMSTSAVSLLSPGVASLTPKVVDIVNIFYPTMVANHIADIQALDRQSGQIFTIKTRYSEDGAGVTAGDIVFETPTDGTYSSEALSAPAVAAATEITSTLALPDGDRAEYNTVKVRAGSVIVRIAGKEIARDYGNGAAKMDGVNNGVYNIIGRGVSGTVNAQSGVITVALDAEMYADAIDNGVMVTFEGALDTETDADLIRKIQFDIPNQPILAKEHPLMSSYSVASGLVMNAHLAIDTDELISNQLAGTIRWERDLALIKAVSGAAVANPDLTFDCAANGENLTLQMRYSSFTTTISTARGIIQETAGRGTVEFIICSARKGLTVIEQIEGFKAAPEAKKPIGPYLAGTLREGTIAVIAVPYTKGATVIADDEVIFGFKGFQLGDSAIVLAEWIPLYFTPTFQAPNLRNHKGALSFYDLFINKPEYLVKGAIKNFNVA